MKKLLSALCLTLTLLAASWSLVYGQSKYARNDPYPVASAASPFGPFTTLFDCDPEFRTRISFSAYRQNADSAGNCNGDTMYSVITDSTTTLKNVNIGDMYGPWNMIALFYPEENGSTAVQQELQSVLGLTSTTPPSCSCAQETDVNDCLTKIYAPRNADIQTKTFGFMQVPYQYRKYGLRFEAIVATPFDLGFWIRLGVAQMRQKICPDPVNLTADPVCGTSACCTDIVKRAIVNQYYLIAQTLGLDLSPYCEASIDQADIAAYWTHSFELNYPSETYSINQPHCTFNPFLMVEFSPPFGKRRPANKPFAPVFNNNHHPAYGVTGGFVFNFLQTIEIGFDVGMTRFVSEPYHAQPVPTHQLQTGMWPRKADLCIKPGTNWTFGAAMASYHFLDHFNFWLEFRMVHHCKDEIGLLRILPLPWYTTTEPIPVVPDTNIKLEKMIGESGWSSSFADLGFTYDITPNVELGIFCQLPIRQRNAYRATTFMGSLVLTF